MKAARALAAILIVLAGATVRAHDLEKTRVAIAIARDGSFTVDVYNGTAWLAERLNSIPGPFADRVVLWIDGRETRAASSERFTAPDGVTVNRLRGRLPDGAHTLRWYYGLVIDPYPLTIRRADGRLAVEEVGGDAWSRTIDVSGQGPEQTLNRIVPVAIAAVFLAPIVLRLRTRIG